MKKKTTSQIETDDLKENRKHILATANSVEYDESDYESQVLDKKEIESNATTIYVYIVSLIFLIILGLVIILVQ